LAETAGVEAGTNHGATRLESSIAALATRSAAAPSASIIDMFAAFGSVLSWRSDRAMLL